MTNEEAIYKAKHLRKVHPNICIDAEDFWETVIAALEREPKTGHWIDVDRIFFRCSECDAYRKMMPAYKEYYCPNCGAKMRMSAE